MHHMQVIRLAHHLSRLTARLFIKHANLAPDHRQLRAALLVGDQGLQPLQPLICDVFGHGRLFGGGCAGTRGIFERKRSAKAYGADQIQRFGEVLLGLAGKAHDEI